MSRWNRRRSGDRTEDLLKDIKWQNVASVLIQHAQLIELRAIKEAIGNMANIAEVQAAVGRIEGNTTNIARVLGELNTINAQLVTQVAALQAQIESGTAVTPEQLQEVLDRLNAADAATDTLAPEAPNIPNEPPAEPPVA